MDRITILHGPNQRTIDLENIKYLIGDNELVKYDIYYSLKSELNKTLNSEYSIENSMKHQCLFNGNAFDSKIWKFIEISPFFDFDSDIKMGTKSLFHKYLESCGEQIEQFSSFKSIQEDVQMLNDELKSFNFNVNQKEVNITLNDLPLATIVKEIIPKISSAESICNVADLSYEDIMLLQISLLEKIAIKSIDKKILCCCFLPKLTPSLRSALIGLRYKNLFLLVFTPDVVCKNLCENIVCSKKYLDLANDDMICDCIMDLPFHIELDEFKKRALSIIENDFADKSDQLTIELFS
ncbi:MAG: hypothetical protein WC366_05265, partial [Bacilli bacterium]